MPRRKAGLQKEFSAIFKDVWIPDKRRASPPDSRQAPQEQNQEHTRRIKEIIARMKCQKDFECFTSGYARLCKAKIVGEGNLVECSPENRQSCEFRFCFVGRSFCKCPLRYYIAKNLNK
jgi:hypothetical protein